MYNTVYQTCQRLLYETARLAELKTELYTSDDGMTSQWISEVIEWAAGGKQDQITEISAESAHCTVFCYIEFTVTFISIETPIAPHTTDGTTQSELQQSIVGHYLSVSQWKQSLYHQNGIPIKQVHKINLLYLIVLTFQQMHAEAQWTSTKLCSN